MLLESVTNEDLSIIREIISLAVGREGKTQDDSRTIFEVSRGATDQLRLLRACAATVSDRSNLRVKSPYEHYRKLLGEMDERWPEASWPAKCMRLEMMINGENDESNVHERSQQYATDHTSTTYIGVPWSSYSILENTHPHHSHHHHCAHQHSCHPSASTSALLNHRSLPNMASHATDTTLRPPTPIANLSSIHPADVTSKNPVLQELDTQASANEPFNQEDLDLPVRRTVVKVFFTWLRHVRRLRQQKARLVTQWVIAAKRDQSSVISKHFRRWLLATRNRKRDTQLMSMKKVLHAFRVNVVYVRRAVDEFQRAHVMKTHFVRWSSKARQLKRKRRDLIINESVVRRMHERHLASAMFRQWRVRASKRLELEALELSFRWQNAQMSIHKMLMFWRKRCLLAHGLKKSLRARDQAVLRKTMNGWRVRATSTRYFQLTTKRLQDKMRLNTLRCLWQLWHQRKQCLKTRRQQAEQAQAWHSRCCLRRALNGWRHWCAPRTKARMVTANRSRRLLQLAWNQWVEATQRQQSTTVSAVFATWRKYASQMKLLRSTRLAAQARRDALLQCRMWHHWRDATCRKAHHLALYTQLCTERMARVQRTAFRIWMLAKALRKHTRNNERQLVPTLFFRWRSRLDYVQKKLPDLLRTFVNQQKIRDTRHYLAWWRLSLRRCRQFSLKSQNVDRDICWRKFFHRWKNLHDMRESQIEQATSLRRLRSLTVIVRHWQDLAAIRGENRERGVIDSFHALKRRWLLRRCFAAFTDQVLRNRQSRLLTSVASKHYLSSLVKRSIQRWKAACHRAGLLRAFAAARYRSYLQRGVLQSWVRARLKRTRQSHAFRLLHSVHVHHLTHEGILRWHDHSVSMRHLRTRCDAVVSVRQKRKITIVWDSWRQCFLQRKLGLQAQLFLVRGNKSIIAGAFCFWRQRHHELLAARWYDARTKLVCWSTWNGRQLMRFHCRLASQLYHKRLKRLAFRAWLWRLWRDVAASTFGTLTSAATRDMCGAVGLRPELTPVMFSRYIRTPPQYNVRDKEGRIHGILATTTVHVPMLLPLDHGSVTTTWPSPLSGRMTLNTHRIAYLKARKQMSIAADDLYRRRLSRKTFCSWVGARRTEVKLRELAIRLASVYGHRRAKTVLRAWVRRTRSMLEKGEHAVTVNAWNVMNRTFLAWKRNTESCGRSAEFAQRLGDHLMCARAWNVWRSRSCDLRLNQRKDTLNAQVSEFRNRKVYFILGSALHKWRRTTKRHAAALATAKTHYRARKIRCVLRFWMGATAGAKVQRLAEAHAVTLHAATLQRRAFSTWWTKYHGLVAERALTLATRQHLLHGYFSMWRARWSRQQRLANQVEALSYLQRILAASRCQRIVNEWRLLVKKRRDLRAAESAFTSRALHFYGLPTKTRVDSGTTRRTICLKAYMRVWVEKHTGLRSDLEKRHRVLYDVLRKWHAWTKYAIDRQRRIGAASNTRLSENYFYIWHRKAVVARKLEKLATAESKWRQQTLAKWLPKWRSRTVTLEEMQSLADDFCGVSILRRRVLQWLGRTQDRMKRRELRSTDQQTAGLNTTAESWKHQAVDDYLYKQEAASSLWRKHLLLRAWRNWRKHVQVKVFESQRKMIFAKTWANKILKRKILAGWRGLLSKENEQPARFKRSPSDFSEVRVLSSLQGDWFGAEVLASTPRRPKMNR